MEQGKLKEAEHMAEALIARAPENALAHYLRGVLYRLENNAAGAISSYNKALKLKPDFKKACSDLAFVLQKTGQLELAIKMCEHLIRLEQAGGEKASETPAPLTATSIKMLKEWNDKGGAYFHRGQMAQAADAWRKATHISAESPELLVNLSVALWSLGRHAESEEILMQCLRRKPGYGPALNQLGNSYKERRYLSKAVAAYRLAHAASPELRQPLLNLGKTYFELQLYAESIDAYARTLTVAPGYTEALGEITYLRQMLCRWEHYAEFKKRFLAAVEDGKLPAEPFIAMVYASAQLQRDNAVRWTNKLHAGYAAWNKKAVLPAAARGDGKLRIGYLSSDFQRHATLALISEIFEQHDRTKFEVYAYSHGIDDGGPERGRIKTVADHFHDLIGLDDSQACDLIRKDQIDILVDLKGYTQNNRLGLMARRPAPVQMHYLGFPGTLGAPFIDYFIADGIAAPPALDGYFTEKLIRLPHSYQINDRKRPRPLDGPSRAEYGLPEKGFVFCGFNNTYKITPEMFDVWMRLLHGVEGSVLWVLESQEESTQNLKREAETRGIDPARIIGAGNTAMDRHLARYRFADLFIDSYPVCGHTTASDALWCGVPVVTLAGESFISRVAASLLHAVELPELATSSLEGYEALALSLACDPGKLGALRRHLNEGRMRFSLFDSVATTRALEAAYQHAAQLQREGRAPEAFTLTSDLSVV
jgi:predicted O-linked N-acetylglucosamine transferase (SPINDLY family)